MNELETCKNFFDACETGKGWNECQQYCLDNASFEAQSGPLAEIKTVEAYTNWMNGLATQTMPGCSYEIHFSGWDSKNRMACFFATFKGTHTGPGPCEPTNKSTSAHYVYALHVNEDGKIDSMTKVWNSHYTCQELGWV